MWHWMLEEAMEIPSDFKIPFEVQKVEYLDTSIMAASRVNRWLRASLLLAELESVALAL